VARIAVLDHADPAVARAIHAVMQAGYAVEAELLGVTHFVPLSRAVEQILKARATFFGVRGVHGGSDRLDAVLELEEDGPDHVHIGSLVVRPERFRAGLASALLEHVLALRATRRLTVSTGVANAPALALYAGAGFAELKRWTTEDGIPMVTLQRR
jgi:ribosomal protein S18 acetylase RimI-like enzyme